MPPQLSDSDFDSCFVVIVDASGYHLENCRLFCPNFFDPLASINHAVSCCSTIVVKKK